MEDKTHLLEVSTRLVYSIEGLSDELRVYWSRVLSIIFSDILPESQIQFNESKAATRRFRNDGALQEFTKSLDKEELIGSLALINTICDHAETLKDQLAARKIRNVIDKIIAWTQLEDKRGNIAEQHAAIQTQLKAFEKRPLVKIPARIWPITLDYVLRCTALMYFNIVVGNREYFYFVNTIVIPSIILLIVYIKSRQDKKYNQRLLLAYGGPQRFNIVNRISTSQYTALALFIGTGLYANMFLIDQADVGIMSLLLFVGLILYYSVCLKLFRAGRINENDLASQVAETDKRRQAWNADENDEVIVNLETKLNAITSRLEAYVLESALFGALSFSGFLQIIANNIISFHDMDHFAQEVKGTSLAFFNFNWPMFFSGLNGLDTDKSLFCLVSVETLVCSIFFLAVIASRLQFSDVSDKVREALNLAKAYNSKEEGLLDKEGLSTKAEERFQYLNLKVNEQLAKATQITDELRPVMQYMQYFRNAGIVVFLILLVSSSLFITGALGWAFTVLGLTTWIYFKRHSIEKSFKSIYLTARNQFIRNGYWLIITAVISIILAYSLRIGLGWDNLDFVRTLGLMLFGLYGITWILFNPHVDHKFGEIETLDKNKIEGNNWRTIKRFFGAAVLVLALALSFKMLYLTGANQLLLLSLGSLSLLGYFLGYYLSKKKWLGILAGVGLGTSFMGPLFKMLHLTGANEMVMLGWMFSLVLLIVFLFKRTLFHKLLAQTYGMILVINFYWFSGLFISHNIYDLLTTGYRHKTFNIDDISLMNSEGNQFRDRDVDSKIRIIALESCIKMNDQYIKKYGTRVGFTDIYRDLMISFSETAQSILDSAKTNNRTLVEKDQSLMEAGYRAAHQANKIESLFNFEHSDPPAYAELEADLLVALHRKEEAIESLRKLIQSSAPQDIRESAEKKLRQLTSTSPR